MLKFSLFNALIIARKKKYTSSSLNQLRFKLALASDFDWSSFLSSTNLGDDHMYSWHPPVDFPIRLCRWFFHCYASLPLSACRFSYQSNHASCQVLGWWWWRCITVCACIYTTDHFKIFEPHYQEIGQFYLVQKHRVTSFWRSKIVKGSVGYPGDQETEIHPPPHKYKWVKKCSERGEVFKNWMHANIHVVYLPSNFDVECVGKKCTMQFR